MAPEVSASIRRVAASYPAVLDTVVIEPDERRVVLTWRATVSCPRAFLYIDWVSIAARSAA